MGLTTYIIYLTSVLITLLVSFLIFNIIRFRSQRKRYSNQHGNKLIVGFFHPYCNDGGGGERVLWASVKAIQEEYHNTHCIIYAGYESGLQSTDVIRKAKERFNIQLHNEVEFVWLRKRVLVEAPTYPRFTMIGQSLGSVLLGWEAITQCNPHVYIDTMGYAFTYPLFKWLGGCRVGCYVHYPTISTDMLSIVSEGRDTYNNRAAAGSIWKTKMKVVYYKIFAAMYSFVGSRAQYVMVNSSWTENHIRYLWNPLHLKLVYPPCNTQTLQEIPFNLPNQKSGREPIIISIGQFRPEKDHPLQVKSLKAFLDKFPKWRGIVKLIIIGSCRNKSDESRLSNLKSLAKELDIEDSIECKVNVSFAELKDWLSRAMIGLHTMWNEHFGIGVVEFMAAGVIAVAHNSGGPKMDIVDMPNTGYLATTADEYADIFNKILEMDENSRRKLQSLARESIHRFSDESFTKDFKGCIRSIMSGNKVH